MDTIYRRSRLKVRLPPAASPRVERGAPVRAGAGAGRRLRWGFGVSLALHLMAVATLARLTPTRPVEVPVTAVAVTLISAESLLDPVPPPALQQLAQIEEESPPPPLDPLPPPPSEELVPVLPVEHPDVPPADVPATNPAAVPPVPAPAAPAPAEHSEEPVHALAADRSDYWMGVRSAIAAHLTYPRTARRHGWEDTVMVRLTVRPHGDLAEVRVLTPEAHDVLRDAALAAVRRAAPFPPVDTNGMTRAEWTVDLPIRFQLAPPPARSDVR